MRFFRGNKRANWLIGVSASMLAGLLGPAAALAQSTPPPPGLDVVFLPPPPEDPDSGTFAYGISRDGTRVGGYTNEGLVRWTNGVPQLLTRGIIYTEAISGDGSTLVGYFAGTGFDPFVWTQSGGFVALPNMDANTSAYGATAVSTDGRYVVVNGSSFLTLDQVTTTGGLDVASAYRWTAAGGYQSIGQFGPPPTAIPGTLISWGVSGTGISGDGSIIVGVASDGSTGLIATGTRGYAPRGTSAFSWTEAGGLQRLPFLSAAPLGSAANTWAQASAISRDGSTIVGGSIGADGLIQAVYWRGGAITGLGFLPGSGAETMARGANADGSVIIGNIVIPSGGEAWRWSFGTGMQSLNEIARNAGLDLHGFSLTGAYGISDNGQFIVGSADNETTGEELAFVMQLAQITRTRLIVIIRLPEVTLQSVVDQSFRTNVTGTLNGASVFNRSFADPITSAIGMQALTDASASLQTMAGLRRVVIGAPTLVSINTTVSNQTSSVTDIVTDTQVTTAAVNTLGPATVFTGDRGICATVAAGGQDPTGCSLPGTATAVDTGILNSNVYTNTVNTVTPTRTTNVNQLITSEWQVAATAGNQFGTVHALAGRVGFDRGDRLLLRAMTLAAAADEGGEARAGAATPAGSRLVAGGRLRLFGEYFGAWQHLSADANVAVARTTGHTDGLTAGLAWDNGEGLRLGAVVDYGKTGMDVRDPVAPERLDVELTQLGAFAGWRGGRLSLSAAAAYGVGNVRTLIDAPGGASRARRDIASWALGGGARYALIEGRSIDLGASVGVRHASVDLHRFTETGGTTPLAGLQRDVERTRLHAGLDASGTGDLRPWAYARAAHDSGDRDGVASVVFAANPALGTFQALGPGASRWSAELGAGLEARLSDTLRLSVAYEGGFRDGENSHSGRAGLNLAF